VTDFDARHIGDRIEATRGAIQRNLEVAGALLGREELGSEGQQQGETHEKDGDKEETAGTDYFAGSGALAIDV
jgi:hypothetical protein